MDSKMKLPFHISLPFSISFAFYYKLLLYSDCFHFVWSNWLDFSVSTAHDVSLCFRSYYVYGPSPYFNTLFATQIEINIIWLNWALIIMLYSFFLWLFCSSVLFWEWYELVLVAYSVNSNRNGGYLLINSTDT